MILEWRKDNEKVILKQLEFSYEIGIVISIVRRNKGYHLVSGKV
jgi:hypothetical protein